MENTSARLVSPVLQSNKSISSCFLFRFHLQVPSILLLLVDNKITYKGADAGDVVIGQASEDGLDQQVKCLPFFWLASDSLSC